LGAAPVNRRRPVSSFSGDDIKMNKWLVFAAVCTLSGSMSQALAAGDLAAGKAASATCAGCHGPDGNSPNPEWPKLAGQGATYLVNQLHSFKGGDRTNATMAPMAMGLSDQDMQNLATYFSSQSMSQGAAQESLVDLGQSIYRGGNPASDVPACIGCHGPTGAGNPAAKFPRLGGQHAKYVENQLLAFKSGERNNDPNKMMRNIASKMTDKEIRAVASYVEGLH
jgi:cytochrome c553